MVNLKLFIEQLLGIKDLSTINSGYASFISTIAALFVASVGWWLNRRSQILADRNKATTEFVSLFKSGELDNHRKNFAKFSNKVQLINSYDECTPEEKKSIIELLKYAEYQSASIRIGLISEMYINLTERTYTHNLFRICSKIILNFRSERKSKTIMENFEIYFIRTFIGNGGFLISILEFLTIRPL